MFFGHISNYQPSHYPKAIQSALAYLKQTDFEQMATGRYPLKGDLVYVQVLDLATKPKAELMLEAHRRYLDVQYLHKGRERMGVAVDLGNNPIAQPYQAERDIVFYESVENESELVLQAGNFAVFFPEDIHRPQMIDGEPCTIRKVVVKIALSELEEAE